MSRDRLRCRRSRGHILPRTGCRESFSGEDAGFTLTELLVVIVILPLVIGAISVALISVLKNQEPVANSLTSSGDAQVSSATYVRDVQGAKWITTDSADLLICTGKAGTLLVSLSPDNVKSSAIQDIISYVAVQNAGLTTYSVFREACSGGKGSSAAGNINAVSHNTLYTPPSCTGSPVTLSIQDSGPPPHPCPGVAQSAAASGWTAASGASTISLLLNEPIRSHNPNGSSYKFTLAASPRTTGTGGATPSGVTPTLPVEFLGSCTLTGSPSKVTSDNGKTPLVAGSGFIGFGGSSNDCTGSGSLNPSSPNSPPTYYNVTDPFAASNLQPPTLPTPPGSSGSCTTGSTITCTPGTYSSSQTFSNLNSGSLCGTTPGVTFTPTAGSPNVVFKGAVGIHNSNVTFGGGSGNAIYWFQQGLTIDTHSNVCFGSATYIFGSPNGSGNGLSITSQTSIGTSDSASGLIFYIPPGTTTASMGSGISGTLSGFPKTSPAYYDGIALWDASTGTLSLGQGNGGGGGLITAQIGGIYDPCPGNVSIAGNYNLQAQFLIACNVTVQTSQVTMTG